MDQRGYPRLAGAHGDAGAAEAQIASSAKPTLLKNAAWTKVTGSQAFQFGFTNSSHLDFTVLASTNAALPLSSWDVLGNAVEGSPGLYQFSDLAVTNAPRRFYCVVSP